MLVCALVGCGGGEATADTGGLDATTGTVDASSGIDVGSETPRSDAHVECDGASDCDDGEHCNGAERCEAGRCVEGTPVDCDDDIACTVDRCDEQRDLCVSAAPDVDEDGFEDMTCLDARGMPLGTDCDDTNPRRFPGAVEVCDTAGVDEDCNLDTRGGIDTDMDGFENRMCCNPRRPGDTVDNCGLDCVDTERSVNPDGTERCNGVDDDCDGATDEVCICPPGSTRTGAAATSCLQFGICATGIETCTDGTVWSGCTIAAQQETCNLVDDDCDGRVDEDTRDASGTVTNDTCACDRGATRLCAGALGVCAAGVETCTDGTTWSTCSIAPSTTDVCDDRDEDCDGSVDEGVSVECWLDGDNDTYAPRSAARVRRCPDPNRPPTFGGCPVNYTNRDPATAADCCDAEPRAHPAQTAFWSVARTTCGGFDYNCDGVETQRWTDTTDGGECTGEASSPTPSSSACMVQSSIQAANPEWLSFEPPACGAGGNLLNQCSWTWVPFIGRDVCVHTPAGLSQECR